YITPCTGPSRRIGASTPRASLTSWNRTPRRRSSSAHARRSSAAYRTAGNVSGDVGKVARFSRPEAPYVAQTTAEREAAATNIRPPTDDTREIYPRIGARSKSGPASPNPINAVDGHYRARAPDSAARSFAPPPYPKAQTSR